MSEIAAGVLAALARYDTATVCNVIELFDVRPYTAGYMNESIQARFPELPPMVGFAATATLRAILPPRGPGGYDWLEDQIGRFTGLPGPAVVVFQDLDQPPVAATFGEVMCTTYKAFGASGLVTSGAGRDLEQVRAIGFPVFASGINPSHGYLHGVAIDVPVNVGGILIHPGDLLHGDGNGVTTVPPEIASDVADACAEFVAAEQIILDAMQDPSPTLPLLRAARLSTKTK